MMKKCRCGFNKDDPPESNRKNRSKSLPPLNLCYKIMNSLPPRTELFPEFNHQRIENQVTSSPPLRPWRSRDPMPHNFFERFHRKPKNTFENHPKFEHNSFTQSFDSPKRVTKPPIFEPNPNFGIPKPCKCKKVPEGINNPEIPNLYPNLPAVEDDVKLYYPVLQSVNTQRPDQRKRGGSCGSSKPKKIQTPDPELSKSSSVVTTQCSTIEDLFTDDQSSTSRGDLKEGCVQRYPTKKEYKKALRRQKRHVKEDEKKSRKRMKIIEKRYRQCTHGFRNACRFGASCTDKVINQFGRTCQERARLRDLAYERRMCGYTEPRLREQDFSCLYGTRASRFGNCNHCDKCVACRTSSGPYTECFKGTIGGGYVLILFLISYFTYHWLKTYQGGVTFTPLWDFTPIWELTEPRSLDITPWMNNTGARLQKHKPDKPFPNNKVSSVFINLNEHYMYSILSFITIQGLSFTLFRAVGSNAKYIVGWVHFLFHLASAWIMYLAYRPALQLKNILSWPQLLHNYTVHAYIGHFVIYLFVFQVFIGICGFLVFPFASSANQFRKYLGYFHQAVGLAIFMGSVASCLTGLEETGVDLLRDDYLLFENQSMWIKLIGGLIGITPLFLFLLLSRSSSKNK